MLARHCEIQGWPSFGTWVNWYGCVGLLRDLGMGHNQPSSTIARAARGVQGIEARHATAISDVVCFLLVCCYLEPFLTLHLVSICVWMSALEFTWVKGAPGSMQNTVILHLHASTHPIQHWCRTVHQVLTMTTHQPINHFQPLLLTIILDCRWPRLNTLNLGQASLSHTSYGQTD